MRHHDHAQSATPARKRRRFDELPPAPEPASTSEHCTIPQLRHPQLQPKDIVLVWDLDETLILFQSLLDGRLAAADSSQVEERESSPVSYAGVPVAVGSQHVSAVL